jgi:hypothetical protein
MEKASIAQANNAHRRCTRLSPVTRPDEPEPDYRPRTGRRDAVFDLLLLGRPMLGVARLSRMTIEDKSRIIGVRRRATRGENKGLNQ